MELKILNWNFDVVFEKGFRNNVNGNNIVRNLGHIDYDNQRIKIDSEDIELQETLFHEILHAVSHYWNANLDENQVTCISVGLYCVLKENGMLNDFKDPKSRKVKSPAKKGKLSKSVVRKAVKAVMEKRK